jgi:hypothetical protein
MCRFVENGWSELPTENTGEDQTSVYYLARTPGFSLFAIGSKLLFPTFELRLLSDPIEVTNGFVEIPLWVANPTRAPVVKTLELSLDDRIVAFEVNLAPLEDELVRVRVPLGETISGIFEVELRETATGLLLDSGQITLLAIAETPAEIPVEVPAEEVTPPTTPPTPTPPLPSPLPSQPPSSPSPLLTLAAVVGVGLGSVCLWGLTRKRIPGTALFRLKKRQIGKLQRTMKAPGPEASTLVQEYFDLLLPIAQKISSKKRKSAAPKYARRT